MPGRCLLPVRPPASRPEPARRTARGRGGRHLGVPRGDGGAVDLARTGRRPRPSQCTRGGARLGMVTVAGVAAGSFAWGAATAVGLAAVVARSAPVLEACRLVGACYLVLLGGAPILAVVSGRARRVAPLLPLDSVGQLRAPAGARSAFSVGLMSDLLNPKIGLFYVAVIPRFVPPGAPALQYSMLLCAVDIGVAVTWLTALTWLARGAVNWLMGPRVGLWGQWIFSACLIGLGVTTAVAR